MRKIILGLSILSIILTAGVMAVEASDGNGSSFKEIIKTKMEEFRNMTPNERKAQKEEAVAAMEELKSSEEWQNADEEARKEMMKNLAEEEGIFPLRGMGRGFGLGDKENAPEINPEHHQAVIDALEAEDYNAWLEATAGRKNAENITEEDFAQLVEAHNLMKAGDKEGAKQIMDELGLNRAPRAMKAFGKGFKKGFQRGLEECEGECNQE